MPQRDPIVIPVNGGRMSDRAAMRASELGEAEFVLQRVALASPAAAERLGISTARIGGGIVSIMANDPTGGFFNVTVGLGQTEPLTQAVLNEVTAFATDAGAPALIFQVAPGADPGDWPDLLTASGITPSRAWVKFAVRRPAVPPYQTDLRIARLGPEHGEAFGNLFVIGFAMPTGAGLEEWLAETPTWTDQGFATYGAWDGDRLVAAAVLFLGPESAVLAGAATLPRYRGRGAQSALMSVRIADALDAGAQWITCETGAETPDSPNPSLHNMRRLGLGEQYERTNWIWRSPTAPNQR
jgi:GNAT superfamily N-acetyltransferase